MNKKRYLSTEISEHVKQSNNYSQIIDHLFEDQNKNWDLLRTNYEALSNVEIKNYDIDGLNIRTQFNPSRIISSSAKVDKKSIENRKCFLCENNLPEVQKGICYKDKYLILCNPYPIFNKHLTIPHHEHIPQQINGTVKDLLNLAYDLRDKYFIFYNGPKCGASAPDHLHFQAGLKNSTPLENDYDNIIRNAEVILADKEITAGIVDESVFKFIFLQSSDTRAILKFFDRIVNYLSNESGSEEEPLLNVISFFKDEKWHLLFFPRKRHRPEEYFLEGEERLLISPASVDMMGLLITPRKEDFDKLTEKDIRNIYDQVLLSSSEILKIRESFLL